MNEKKEFEMPAITTYRQDELIVEIAFTGLTRNSNFALSDRRLKKGFRPVSSQIALGCLLRHCQTPSDDILSKN